jgi:oligopeptide transport permease C-like protein
MANGAKAIEIALPGSVREARPWGAALWEFMKKKPLGAAGGFLVILLILTSIFADTLATHNPMRTSSQVLAPPSANSCWAPTIWAAISGAG